MKLPAILLFLAGLFNQPALSQSLPILINAGSSVPSTGPTPGTYLPDQGFTGGLPYSTTKDGVTSPGIYQTSRYGTSFSYDLFVPISTGTCSVAFDLIENRSATTNPKAAAGTRLFTIIVNGQSSPVLDLFLLAGPQVPYVYALAAVPVTTGRIHADFLAQPNKGNAVVSAPEVLSCTPTPTPPPTTVVLPKFITEIFPIPSGQPTSVLLSKTPNPDSGMLIQFSTSFVGEDVFTALTPQGSKQIDFTPPANITLATHDGTLRVIYWTLDQ